MVRSTNRFCWVMTWAAFLFSCGGEDSDNDSFVWGANGNKDAGSKDVETNGDVALSDSAHGDSALGDLGANDVSAGCLVQDDISDRLSGELFYGYPSLGVDAVTLGCAEKVGAKEVAVRFTPNFAGEIVLSTHHPSTKGASTLELRKGDCAGEVEGCSRGADVSAPGSRLIAGVSPGTEYVAIMEAEEPGASIALGVHPVGVCEERGNSVDITSAILKGERFVVDTASSTSSIRGNCSTLGVEAPEARVHFTSSRTGSMGVTAVHPNSTFDPLLFVRETAVAGGSYCDSPEAEIMCSNGVLEGIARFDVQQGRMYDLIVDGATVGAKGTATLTLGFVHTSPVQERLNACNHTANRDQFAALLVAGQSVTALVDSVDSATAADTRLRCMGPDGSQLFEADDDVACTFPPPKYSCPKKTFQPTTTGVYVFEVYVGTSQSCRDMNQVNYVIKAEAGGQPLTLIHIKDQ